jgi:hypothetical protein
LSIYGHHSAMIAQSGETAVNVTAGLSRHFDDGGNFLSPPPPEYGNIVASVTSSASISSSAASPYYSYPTSGSYSSVCHASQQQANLYASYSTSGSAANASLSYPSSISPSVAPEYYVGMFDRDAGAGYGSGIIPLSSSPNATANHGYSMASPPPPPVYPHPSSLEQSPSSASRSVASSEAAVEAGWHPSSWASSHSHHHGSMSAIESFHIPGFASQTDAELALSGKKKYAQKMGAAA